ncbi:DUF3868 domain-containing protein [Dysgonomonas sp. GY75]|nr:DUF3868 domain-containing protein [Dysgonomonas sp. GY75]
MCRIEYSPIITERQSGRFYIGLDMHFACRTVTADQAYWFIPVLTDGQRRRELPVVLVAGRSRYRSMRLALWGLGRGILRAYHIKKLLKAAGGAVIDYPYLISLDYEEWMDRAEISILHQ